MRCSLAGNASGGNTLTAPTGRFPGGVPAEFEIKEHREGQAIRVVIKGELDIANEPALRAHLEALKPHDGPLTIDLRNLTFIDSSGARLLVETDAFARKDGWGLTVIPGPPIVHRVLELTGLTKTLTFADPDG